VIEFADGQRIEFNKEATFRVGGMLVGKRKVNYKGDIIFEDKRN
jgi:hypothetical protein